MRHLFTAIYLFFFIINANAHSNAHNYPINLSERQISLLAELIWKNEGAGKVEYLTVWNKNEDFPSMGIGHFIWYPTEQKGPYIEQFPQLITFLTEQEVSIPRWLIESKVAPWQSRDAFYDDYQSAKLVELRDLLLRTRSLQAQFIIQRLEKGLPSIIASSNATQRIKIETELARLTNTAEGVFVLLDYVNFKGEGISDKEQYQGQGWGLKQVLLAMPEQSDNTLLSFALAADEVLTRRVKNAPRDELAWLKGWRVRIHQYPTLQLQTD